MWTSEQTSWDLVFAGSWRFHPLDEVLCICGHLCTRVEMGTDFSLIGIPATDWHSGE